MNQPTKEQIKEAIANSEKYATLDKESIKKTDIKQETNEIIRNIE